ncbi:MAG: sodium:calcium antiporter [Gammaproteobacteria bacterium]
MPDLSAYAWPVNAAVLAAAAGIIAWAGSRLAALADRFADRTGLGEALTGTLLLGLVTALPGLAASVTAALDGHPALAIGNAIGGIALQTTFLAVADLVYVKANLEHASASLLNLIQTAILAALLTLVLLGLSGPDVTIAHVHPITPLLLLAAAGGVWLVRRSRRDPMWQPRQTTATVADLPQAAHLRESLLRLTGSFAATAGVVTAAGAVVAHTAGNISERTGINDAVAGALLAGVVTSLPELVTTVAAVRRGALTLAVSDIVGGNFFDVLFLVVADLVYLRGSLYHAAGVGAREIFMTALAVALNVVLLIGLLYRQRAGPANIGFESALLLLIYLAGFAVLSLLM